MEDTMEDITVGIITVDIMEDITVDITADLIWNIFNTYHIEGSFRISCTSSLSTATTAPLTTNSSRLSRCLTLTRSRFVSIPSFLPPSTHASAQKPPSKTLFALSLPQLTKPEHFISKRQNELYANAELLGVQIRVYFIGIFPFLFRCDYGNKNGPVLVDERAEF